MWRSLLAPILFIGWVLSSPHYPRPVERAMSSVLRITSVVMTPFGEGNAVCTGEVIAPKYVLTARHCLGEKMKADGYDAVPVKADDYYDLLLLKVKDTTRKPLTLSDEVPQECWVSDRSKCEHLTAIGYAYGNDYLIPISATVVKVNRPAPWEDQKTTAPGILVSEPYIPGMSGGPVVNADGEMVGIVQQTDVLGWGVGTQLVKAFLLGVDMTK